MAVKIFKGIKYSDKEIYELRTKETVSPYKNIFDNKKLVDTAGFVPLNVRIKQFLLSGEQAKLSSEMFDSDDWRYMYENINDNSLEVGDDIEDVQTKLNRVIARQNEILLRKSGFSTLDQTSEEERSGKQTSAESVEKPESPKGEKD